jgi:hypothetical protein
MTLEVQYNMTVDLINPNNNVSSKYPLVQGTKPKIILTIKEDGTIEADTEYMDGPRLKFFTRAIMKKFAERISII